MTNAKRLGAKAVRVSREKEWAALDRLPLEARRFLQEAESGNWSAYRMAKQIAECDDLAEVVVRWQKADDKLKQDYRDLQETMAALPQLWSRKD